MLAGLVDNQPPTRTTPLGLRHENLVACTEHVQEAVGCSAASSPRVHLYPEGFSDLVPGPRVRQVA